VNPGRPHGPGSPLARRLLPVKRLLDVCWSLAGLVLLTPVIAAVAVAVLVVQGRPILFRQQRPGLHGEVFTILKFRSMRSPRPGEVWYLTDDQRITRLGRFLRSSSLDELPELWNVLRGEMSLVGPRPLLVEYLDDYTPEERRRHDMPPGITGWAAVNGRNTLQFRDRLALDVWYVDHWSPLLDLRIVAMTISQVLRRSTVTETEDLALGFPLEGAAEAIAAREPANPDEVPTAAG
jgi:sugar transferase EpsL